MPLNALLFFADAGDELSGYSVARAGLVEHHLYVWDPITLAERRQPVVVVDALRAEVPVAYPAPD